MDLQNIPEIDNQSIREKTWFEVLEAQGISITEKQKQEICRKVNELLEYQPAIGLFGKTGAGKSSLCNALFGQDVCAIDDVAACTRDPQTILLNMGGNGIRLIDVPGVGESAEEDRICETLYADLLPRLDMVLWLVKADDRATAADQEFYQRLVRPAAEEGKPVLLVLTQVDKLEPCREWDMQKHEPGAVQFRNIHRKAACMAEEFGLRTGQVIPVSASERYNLTKLVDEMVFALPAQQNAAVLRAVKSEYRSEEAAEYVNDNLLDMIGEIVSSVCFSASLAASEIADAIHNWWKTHKPWWC